MEIMDEKKSVEITTKFDAGVVVFQAASISDVEEIGRISNKIADFVVKNKPSKLVFDFQKVKFFSSQILGMLLDMRARLSANNGEVVISAINPQLHRVFRITNLDKIFRFFPDVESAVKTTNTTNKD
jgi:anti-sigma B factor antagonist